MLISIIILTTGFITLTLAADALIRGAASIATRLGLPSLFVGITLVAMGTSLPEMVVALSASLAGNPGIAIGNAIGSNIANIGLVFGICAIFSQVTIHSTIVSREFPILIFIMALLTLIVIDLRLQVLDGIALVFAFVLFIVWLGYQALMKNSKDTLIQDVESELPQDSLFKSCGLFFIGVILLPISSYYIVDSATAIARALQINEFIIGLTLIALGTSLPEVATAISATLKKEYDLVIGNILGSNIFNILAVLPFPAILSPSTLDQQFIIRDMGSMFILTFALYFFALRNKPIGRWKGLCLMSLYGAYIALLVFQG